MPLVNVPGVGRVNFPDSMSQDQIVSAIETDILPNYATQTPQAAPATPIPAAPQSTDEGLFSRFAKEPGYLGAAIEKGYNNLRLIPLGLQLSEYGALLDTFTKEYTPEQIAANPKLQEEYTKRQNKYLELSNEYKAISAENELITKTRTRPETQLAYGVGKEPRGWLDAAKDIGTAILQDPGVVADIGLESSATLASATFALVTSYATRDPKLAALVGGTTSGAAEFSSEYAENRAKGMNHQEAWESAVAKAGVVGAFDAVSMNTAGKTLDRVVDAINSGKGFKGRMLAAKEIAKETGVQGALGMAGEAVGTLATGEEIDPTSVLLEGVGEIAGAPLEAISTRGEIKSTLKKAKQRAQTPEERAIAALDAAAEAENELGKRAGAVPGGDVAGVSTTGVPGGEGIAGVSTTPESAGLDRTGAAISGARAGEETSPAALTEDQLLAQEEARLEREAIQAEGQPPAAESEDNIPLTLAPLEKVEPQTTPTVDVSQYSSSNAPQAVKEKAAELTTTDSDVKRFLRVNDTLSTPGASLRPDYKDALVAEHQELSNLIGSKYGQDILFELSNENYGALLEQYVSQIPMFAPAEVVPRQQTKTPQFKNWFRQSKVVDETDTPLVLYHGTEADIEAFKLGKEGGALGNGIYLTPSPEFASSYAEKAGGNVMPLYASIQNPLRLDGSISKDPMVEALVRLGVDKGKAEKIVEKAYDNKGYITNEVKSRATAQGYDGIMQTRDGALTEVVAFRPNQVKSAIGNRGTFDINSPSVVFAPPDAPTELKGAPSGNIKRLGNMLGSMLYGKPDTIASVTVKELVQNSFDAIKEGMEKFGLAKGDIKIDVNQDTRTITVVDNGPGMPGKVMSNEFLQIAGTVKGTDNPSGGLGIAKMLFLFENEKLEVTSLRDGVASRMVTTGEELKGMLGSNPRMLLDQLKEFLDEEQLSLIAPIIEDAAAKQAKLTGKPQEVKISQTTDADVIKKLTKNLFPDGHGTAIKVQVPKTYVDTTNNEAKAIPFNTYELKELAVLEHSPLFRNIDVTFGDGRYARFLDSAKTQFDIGSKFPADKFTQFANVRFGWGTARIYVTKDKITEYQRNNTHILSNGLWQFSTKIMDKPGFGGRQINRTFYVDVVPYKNVTSDSAGYPFALNRQNFSLSARGDFDKIFRYISIIYAQIDFAEDVKNFGKVRYINSDGTFSATELLEPKAPATDNAFSLIRPEDNVEVKDGALLVNGRQVPELTDEDLKNTTIRFDELTIPQDEIDPKRVMVHDNTIDASGRSISDNARAKFGARFDNYLAQIGGVFQLLRRTVVDESENRTSKDYSDLAKEAIGISIPIKEANYLGVSIKIPFKGMFINPTATHADRYTAVTPRDVAVHLITTMVHELAHFKERDHDASFASELQHLLVLLDTSASYNLSDAKNSLSKFITDNFDIYKFLNKEFYDGNYKAIGNTFKDAGYQQIRNERDVENTPSTGGTGVWGSGLPESTDRSVDGLGKQHQRAVDDNEAPAKASEYTEQWERLVAQFSGPTLIHPSVYKAIQANDINGALRELAKHVSGFSRDLALRLVEVGLTTSIFFDQHRRLVRENIDIGTKPQQDRLFRYLRLAYPAFYDKYFVNYGSADALTGVWAGLSEIEKRGINIHPVAAEYTDVKKKYDENMPGISAPGAYFPHANSITLNTSSLTGKSNRVVLHEIVHAATMTIISQYRKDPSLLTARQIEAVESLIDMYEYAKASNRIPTNEYGLTNLEEFIAEAFTNRKFNNLLRSIRYNKAGKQPLITRFYNSILKAFGFGNLASNVLAEAEIIFAPQRREGGGAATAGVKFAKKNVGPLSTPSNWKTAEDAQITFTALINSAIKGRRSWDEVLKIVAPSMWDSSAGVGRRTLLGFANLRQIADITKTKFPQIDSAIRIIEQMLAHRGRLLTEAEGVVKEWATAQAKNPEQSRLLGRVMLEATIRGVDPDTTARGTFEPALQDAWDLLKPEFQKIYRDVRDFYETSVRDMVKTMKDRAAALPPTERAEMIKKIDEQFGASKLKRPYFPLRRFGTYWFQVGKGADKEFYEFESAIAREFAMRNRRAQLMNGTPAQQDLAKTISKGNGISELYSQNISTTKALKDVQELVDGITATDVAGLKKELQDSLNQLIYMLLPQQSMRKMFINRKSIQGASSDMLRVFATSAVHSAYQQSRFKYAEPFINNLNAAREYVNEFTDPDRAAVYRDYIQEVEKRAPTILSTEDTSMAAQVAGRLSELTFYFMLSAPFTSILNTLGFTQITLPYIGGRYGYKKAYNVALKNFGRYSASVPTRTFAPLRQGIGGVMQMNFPSIMQGGGLSPLLQKAADRFIDEGQVNISLTNDILDIGERPSALYTGRLNTVKKALSALFHQSERVNREVTLLTVFELAHEKFLTADKKDLKGVIQRDAQGQPLKYTADEAFELAINEAKDIAGLSLGDFTRQMKPRYFTPPLLSVLTKFKQYAVLATYATVRNFQLGFLAPFSKAELNELRDALAKQQLSPQVIEQRVAEAQAQQKELAREGRRRLAGILGTTFLYGGVEALPFFWLVGTVLSAGFGPGDDEDEFFDWKNWFRNYMEENLGGAAGEMYLMLGFNKESAEKAGRKFGASVARGVVTTAVGGALSERVSMDVKDLWYREGRYSNDVRQSLMEGMIANAGPVVGLTMNTVEAYKLMQEGQYERAFEKALPAIVTKPLTAARLASEGAKTPNGIRLVDNFTAWELAMQAVGLQPERLAQAQQAGIQTKEKEQKIIAEHDAILNRLWMERNNSEAFSNAITDAVKFSRRHPGMKIDSEAIKKSFEKRAENAAQAEAVGAQVNKKLLPELQKMLRYGRE